MARPASDQPTDGELEILNILWEIGPAELRLIHAALNARRKVATTTVATMLGVMLDKGSCGVPAADADISGPPPSPAKTPPAGWSASSSIASSTARPAGLSPISWRRASSATPSDAKFSSYWRRPPKTPRNRRKERKAIMNFLTFLSEFDLAGGAISRYWIAAGWTMLHFLWLGTAIGLAAWAIRRVLRPLGPRICYVALLLLLFAMPAGAVRLYGWILDRTPAPIDASAIAIPIDPLTASPAAVASTPQAIAPAPAPPVITPADALRQEGAPMARRGGAVCPVAVADRHARHACCSWRSVWRAPNVSAATAGCS